MVEGSKALLCHQSQPSVLGGRPPANKHTYVSVESPSFGIHFGLLLVSFSDGCSLCWLLKLLGWTVRTDAASTTLGFSSVVGFRDLYQGLGGGATDAASTTIKPPKGNLIRSFTALGLQGT